MKKLLMLSALSFMFASTTVFAACPCQPKKITCNPCERPKITCCEQVTHDMHYRAQCCKKKSFFSKLWSGTKTVYDNSVGAVYDTVTYPFR